MSLREPLYGAAAREVRDQLAGHSGALSPAIADLLAAIVESLDVPLADMPVHDKARADLLTLRAGDTRVIAELLLAHGDVARAAARLREWTAEHPVTYPTWQDRTEQAAAEEAQLLAEPRCPAAHPEDPTGCNGPVLVTVLDAKNTGALGCTHHAARLLASLDGGRVYGLPDAPAGTAIAVFKAAGALRPFPWIERGEQQ